MTQINFNNFTSVIIISTNHTDNNNYIPISDKAIYKTHTFGINSSNIKIYQNNVIKNDKPFMTEHSWKIIIPYLAHYNISTILPIIVGNNNLPIEIIDTNKTLIIGNTDLLHCGPNYKNTCSSPRQYDKETYNLIIRHLCYEDNINEIGNRSMCGKYAVILWLNLMRQYNLTYYKHFYDSTNGINHVGYLGILCIKLSPLSLPRIALWYRLKLNSKIISQTNLCDIVDMHIPKKYTHCGIFVSIYKNSILRGCIGTYNLFGNTCNKIIETSYDSAFKDFRFNKIDKTELRELEYKVNFLTNFMTIYDDPDTKLNPYSAIKDKFIIGKHGIIIHFGNINKQATYLANVMIDSFNMKLNNKLTFDEFIFIADSLAKKAHANTAKITKIELYDCVEYDEYDEYNEYNEYDEYD